MVKIERYTSSGREEWDAFVGTARNATFLHRRGYMDYHSDRFADCSLLARDGGGHLVAALPACVTETDATLWSHRGLTYGGWLMNLRHATVPVMADVGAAMTAWCRAEGLRRLVYKPVPHIYHAYPADDDIYALVQQGAHHTECAISTAIDLHCPLPPDRGNRSAVNAARRHGVVTGSSQQWDEFWPLLTKVLAERHGAQPVHTLDEILLLHNRFPNEITLHTATAGPAGDLLAGVVMYWAGPVAHAQYIAASDTGRDLRAMPLLMSDLIATATQRGCRYFDFGISTEDHGHYLNRGLAEQKARLGGRGVAYNTYELDF